MSVYHAVIHWTRGQDGFLRQQYSRAHHWEFDEGLTVPASASPHAVRAPWAVAAAVDPEEALVAAVSSCHMLFFLSIASRAGIVVERYDDPAEGLMERRPDGRVAITQVTLRPRVAISGTPPTAEEFARWHHEAHEECYIASSIRAEVICEPELVPVS